MTKSSQQGVGLVEVMVALLLLAVAILSFSALNMTAINATDNSVIRIKSTTIIRSISEDLRLNPDSITSYQQNIQQVLANVSPAKNYCQSAAAFKAAKVSKECHDNACSKTEVANYDSWRMMQQACDNNVLLNMVDCPGTANKQRRQCVIIAWGDTQPVLSDTTATNRSCANLSGTYYSDAQCLIMETY